MKLSRGTHIAHLFSNSAEKQATLFHFCDEAVNSERSYLLYIAGKQGVKGIRLSLKDVRFNVALYERARQLKIVDSDEWYLESGRQKLSFKTNEKLKEQLAGVISEASNAGFSFVTVISETDSLVRKGFYREYSEYDKSLGAEIPVLAAAFICAFDRREMEAAGVLNIREDLSKSHSEIVA
jgi:MEDS: MEthanogen/methylotroph, DcmR Sensory domain